MEFSGTGSVKRETQNKRNRITMNTLSRGLILLLCCTGAGASSLPDTSEPVQLNVILSENSVKAGQEIELSVSAADPIDPFFFSVEVHFDSQSLEFTGIDFGNLTDGGVKIASLLSDNRIGASVSRTSVYGSATTGELMRLRFLVRQKTDAGSHYFEFSNQTLVTSSDETLESEQIEPVQYMVEESLVSSVLQLNPLTEVYEGENVEATVKVYATGVSQDESNSGRILAWLGIHDIDSNPAEWGEGSWHEMSFSGESDGYFEFMGEAAYGWPVGTWYLAVRTVLDSEGIDQYGGINGVWNGDSAVLSIAENPPYRYTLAAWNFDNDSLDPSSSIPQNSQASIQTVGANDPTFINNGQGRAATASGWHQYDEQNPAHWLVQLSTENFESIWLQSDHSGTNTGPRDFVLEISSDGINWAVIGDPIVMTDRFETYHHELPALANNRPELYIRWVQASDVRLDGDTESEISSQGSNRIDNIILSGINPNAETISVWPGDTHNNGLVNEEDVLPLSLYWQLEGPRPVYNTRSWEERETESWLPAEATYADANGDGVVNHLDLLPIALNFGKTRSLDKIVGNPEVGPEGRTLNPLSSLTADALRSGDELELYFYTEYEAALSGISFSLRVEGIDPALWQVSAIDPGRWGVDWRDRGQLIDFSTVHQNSIAGALSHRGVIEPNYSRELIKVTLRATGDWNQSAEIHLERVSKVSGNSIQRLNDAYLTVEQEAAEADPDPEIPLRTELLPNFPNPFNPSTTIQFRVDREAHVTITVYNALGRKVATLIDRMQEPGLQEVQFDASHLSSGIYFYRIQTDRFTETRSMALIK